MEQKLFATASDFEQPRRVRANYLWVTPAVLLGLYYLYALFNGWSVEVVELRPSRCELVEHFDSSYFKYRNEGILELKSKTASLGADTLYAPFPRDVPYGLSATDDRQVFVPARAYRCDS
jgi:hypothetical protein